MRIVTSVHFKRLEAVVAKASAVCRTESAAARNMADVTAQLWDAGRPLQASERGSREIARLKIAEAKLAAEVESAAVAFLGERRHEDEGLARYLERLGTLCTDLSTILAAQRRNSIRWQS